MKTRQTIKSGFTLIEVSLVMAIATLLFMALAFGYSGRIATGRFETASNETVSFLRNIYNAVLNTENSRQGASFSRPVCTLAGTDNSVDVLSYGGKDSYTNNDVTAGSKTADPNADYAGRTDCSIYGNLVFFGTTDGKIYNFALVGDSVDYNNLSNLQSIQQEQGALAALKEVHLDYLAAVPTQQQTDLTNHSGVNCYVRSAGDYTTYEQSWGGKFVSANSSSGGPFKGMLMIVRAPATGELATYVYEDIGADETDLYDFEFLKTPENINNGVNCTTNSPQTIKNLKSLDIDQFKDFQLAAEANDYHLGFCIDSEDFLIATSNRQKFVSFAENGQNATAIKLDETDGNPCRS